MIVADTNLIAYLLIPGEHTKQVEQVIKKDSEWIAPQLWQSEFRNVLSTYMRKKLISLENAIYLTELAEDIMTSPEYMVSSEHILALANESGCAAYDCEYVALSQLLNMPLLTYDQKILTHFPAIACSPSKWL